MSNFLTVDSSVERYRQELQRLFRDLRPGAIAVVLGATGDSYQRIYAQLEQLAVDNGFVSAGAWHADDLGRNGEAASERIKRCQYYVYRHLAAIVGDENLQTEGWPDYWSPVPSPRTRPKFALRTFRKGRWPGITRSRQRRVEADEPRSRA
jgi:hypothetical protein